jgi:small-conductance mechanosensitive channel
MNHIIYTAITLGITVLAYKLVGKLYQRVPKSSVTRTFIYDVVRVTVIILGILGVIIQIPSAANTWDRLLAGSGVIAVIIGLAAQTSFGNIFSGIMILVSKPFEIGDRIQIGEDVGYVTGLTLQYTVITTYLNEEVTIPNSVVSSTRIKNYSKVNGASYPIEITVGYDTNLEKAKQIMIDVITKHPKYSDKFGTPTVLVKEAGDYGIKLKVVVTTEKPEDNAVACSDCLEGIIVEFQKESIDIPYPIVNIQKDTN